MGNYGRAAEIAVTLLREDESVSPRDAWQRAVEQIFPDSHSARMKGCPRDAFLSLCEVGVVHGVSAGSYTRSVKNKAYVNRALAALRESPSLVDDEKRLWRIATDGADTRPNSQLDVLTTLWRRDLLRRTRP